MPARCGRHAFAEALTIRVMKHPLINCRVEWLCEEGSYPAQYLHESGYMRDRIPLPEGEGGGWIEVLVLDRGICVSRAEHAFDAGQQGDLVPVGRVEADLSGPTLIVQSMRSGQAVIKENVVGREFVLGAGNSIFHNVERLDFEPRLENSEDVHVYVMKILHQTLHEFIGEQYVCALLEGLAVTNRPGATVVRVPQNISSMLHRSLMVSNAEGTLRRLHAEARVLDYLCALVEHFSNGSNNKASSVKNRKMIVNELYDELMQLEGKLPKLSELANRYGTSAKTLNEAFKEVYGEPIATFLTNHRLSEAHVVLERDRVPIKVLAMRLGYSHVNHFITAFRKKFGYPPGYVRKHIAHIQTLNK